MDKTTFIKAVAAESGLTVKSAALAVAAMQTIITRSICRGESVTLKGFGTFSVRTYKARAGRNPRTGASITIPARRRVRFTPGKMLDMPER